MWRHCGRQRAGPGAHGLSCRRNGDWPGLNEYGSAAVGQVLGTQPEVTIDLNLRIRNSAVTEFAFTPKRHMLLTYNTLPHLDAPDFSGWVTYA